MIHSTQATGSIPVGEETTYNGTPNNPSPPTDTPSPFNSPHADVILQSSDGVNFGVRKAILAEASPFFETMFSLPTIGTSTDSQSQASAPDSLPIVPMQEDSTTVVGLLWFCYPAGRRLQGMDLNDISLLLPAARKYAMDRMVDYITPALRGFVENSSLRVYCLATCHQLDEDLIRAAARGFLDQPIEAAYTHIAELDHINGSTYARLLDYHHRCSVRVQQVFVRYYAGIDSTWDERCWRECYGADTNKGCTYKCLENSRRVSVWFYNFMQTCRNLAKARPSGKEITSQSAIATALVSAGKCAHCGGRAWADLQSFLPLLMGKIDDAISEVSLEFIA